MSYIDTPERRKMRAARRLTTPATPDNNLGWAANIPSAQAAKDLLNRADVRAELRTFYRDRDGFNGSDDELVDKFYSDRTWRNVNTVSMVRDAVDAQTMTPGQATTLARVQKLYDALPNFYEEGGRGLAGLGQNIVAGVVDPINLVGFGAGATAGKAAMREGTKAAVAAGLSVGKSSMNNAALNFSKQARSQIIRQGLVAGAKSGAIKEGILNAGIGAGQDVIMQNRNQSLGLQDEFSTTSMLTNAAFGGALGAGFGTVAGAAGAVIPDPMRHIRKTMFGDRTSKYSRPEEQTSPSGVGEDIDTSATDKPLSDAEKDDAKVNSYISEQLKQYKRNLDSVIDDLRAESGEKGLAEWNTGRVEANKKTETMQLADDLQEGHAAVNELYKWPTTKAAYQRQLDALNRQESPKPEVLDRIFQLEDQIQRGNDAYEAIVRAAGSGDEAGFDKTLLDYIKAKKTLTEKPAAEQPQAAPAVSQPDNTVAAALKALLDDETVAARVGPSAERADAEAALASNDDAAMRLAIKNIATNDMILTEPSPIKAVENAMSAISPRETPAEIITPDTPEALADALASVKKQYNALTNKIARLNKSIEAGKGSPDAADQLKKLVAEREVINNHNTKLKEKLTSFERADKPEDLTPKEPVLSIEAEASQSPLDNDGVATFLADYGFIRAAIKQELAAYLKSKPTSSRGARAALTREFVQSKIRYSRSITALDKVFSTYTESVAFVPSGMRRLIEIDGKTPKDMIPDVIARYNEWLEMQAPNIYAQYMSKNPEFTHEDILGMISASHGDEMVSIITRALSEDDAGPSLQFMSIKKADPSGFDKLTDLQKESVNKKLEAAKGRLMGLVNGKQLSEKKMHAMLAVARENMILEMLFTDFESSFGRARSSNDITARNITTLSVIKDGDVTVSGKTLRDSMPKFDKETGTWSSPDYRQVARGDRFGLQGMLRKSNSGLASGIDEHGDLVIEYPYFGTLFVKDIVRASDGSIDYAKTTEGKYVLGKNGQMIRKTFSAADTAEREMDKASLGRASKNRMVNNPFEAERNKDIVELYAQSKKSMTAQVAELLGVDPKEAYRVAKGVTPLDFKSSVKYKILKLKTYITADKTIRRLVDEDVNGAQLIEEYIDTIEKSRAFTQTSEAERRGEEILNRKPNEKNKAKGVPEENEAEALNKAIREFKKSAVLKEAVRNAEETSSDPSATLAKNVAESEEYLGEAITQTEVEKAYAAIEAEDRSAASARAREVKMAEAIAAYQMHGNQEAFLKDCMAIANELDPKAQKPKTHSDKPVGANHEPRVYVYKGFEVDVRNHFQYKKITDDNMSVRFLGEEVGTLIKGKDGSATILYTNADGIELQAKASSMDAMASFMPRVFEDQIVEAGTAGKLTKATDESSSSVYPIDWKVSNTWGKTKRTVPVETPASETPKLVGPVTDYQGNLDVSAANLPIPDGHVMAIHILEGKSQGVTRVESNRSAVPQTVGQILGGQKSVRYSVGYVPEGTKSTSREASRLFTPLNANDEVFRPGAPASGKPKANPVIKEDRNGQIPLESLGLIQIDQDSLPVRFRNTGIKTLANLHNNIIEMENVPWAHIADERQYATFVQDIGDLYEVRQRHAPKGIKLPTASRIQSMNQWQRAMSNHDAITVSTGIDLLRRLSFNDRDLPQLAHGAGDNSYALPTAGRVEANNIFLNPSALNPNGTGNIIPQPVALIHEVGHWAYMNILDDADRMQFWRSIGKYFQDGKLDLQQVRERLPGINTNEDISPAEFFANQFSQWAISEGKMNNIPLWTKMAQKIVRFAQGLGVRLTATGRGIASPDLVDIDADLAELFTKILPETDEMYDRYVSAAGLLADVRKIKDDSYSRTASVAAKVLLELDFVRKDIDDALDGQDPSVIAEKVDAAANRIRGMTGGKVGASKHPELANKPGTGKSRFQMFDGKQGGKKYSATMYARREMLKAYYEWKQFQREMYSDDVTAGKSVTLDTSANEGTLSGDIGSTFDASADILYSGLNEDSLGDLNMHANKMIAALAVAQDELRAVIGRVGQMDGTPIRITKDGKIENKPESTFTKFQKKRAATREASKEKRAAAVIAEAINDYENVSASSADRDALPAQLPQDAMSSKAVSTMQEQEIVSELRALAGKASPRKKDLQREMIARIDAIPAVKIVPISEDLIDIPINRLEKDLWSAINRGKLDDVKKYSEAIAWKKRQRLQEGLLTPTSVAVKKAATIIKEQTKRGTSDNGVPQNMPAQPREVVRLINNRKRTDEANSRMVATRFIAILGKGENALTEQGFVTKSDLSKLLGMADSADNTPVSEIDVEFNKFRDTMRELGTDMKSKATQPRGLTTISKLAINALVPQEFLKDIGLNSEELASRFIAIMRNSGGVNDYFDELPIPMRAKVSEYLRENMEAVKLVSSGLVHKDTKATFQNMSFAANMMAEHDVTYKHLSSAGGLRGMHPAIANNFRAETLRKTPAGKRIVIEAFTGQSMDDSMFFAYNPTGTPSSLVDGVGFPAPIKSDGVFGRGVYLRKDIPELSDADIAAISPDAMTDDLVWSNSLVNRLSKKLATEKANVEMLMARGEDASDLLHDVVYPLERRLEKAIGEDTGLLRQARTLGMIDKPRAVPFVARVLNSFDFSPSAAYTFGEPSINSLDWLVATLEANKLISPNASQQIKSAGGRKTGVEAHGLLVRAMTSNGISRDSAINSLNKTLTDLGYDSINDGNGYMVFDETNVRHLDDNAFNLEESLMESAGQDSVRSGLSSDLFSAMLDGPVNRDDTSGAVLTLQAMKAPAMITEPMKKIIKRKPVTGDDIAKISFFTRLYRENSQRFALSGAKWFSDKIKPASGVGFYEKKDSEIAKALTVSKDEKGRPVMITSKLRKLPDYTNTATRRWMNRNKFWGVAAQPQSHARILGALRRGDDAIKKLSKLEREIAMDVRKFFQQELGKAIEDGLPLSYRRDYVPQVWNADQIKSDPSAFVKTMKEYFLREMRNGEVPTPTTKSSDLVAEEKAMMLMKTLTSEGSDGVMLPDNALRSRMEDHFFERVINLRAEDLPGAERFLVNDLEGILVKYADQITTRRLLTKEFGLGNHAVSTYLNILVNGRDAVVDALRNTKTFARERWAADYAMDQRVLETTEVITPIEGTEQEVAEIVDEAIKMLGNDKRKWQANKEKVRNFLINLQEPEIVASQPEFTKRIDAIVNALAEFGGQPNMVEPHEVNAMSTMVAGMAKKPIDQGWTNTPQMMKFSRSMRTFNNISLLTFTTLASIPDLAMPLIRSGNFGAMQKAWSSYMTDPHYREMARSIGVGVESVLHERMSHMYNDTASRASNAFFNMTFLNQWTNMNREVAALVGFESFKAEAKRAQDLMARGMQNTAKYKTAYRYLQRYGLESYALPGAKVLGNVSESGTNDALRYAMMRFTNEAIFAPNPNDVPLWAQNPVGMLIFQLKSYPLMMSRMAGYTLSEFKAGNHKPLAMLLAAGGVLGSTSLALRDVVQGRGDTDGDGYPDQAFRDRYGSEGAVSGIVLRWYNQVAEDMGLDVEAGGTADLVIGWLSEALMVAGGFGLFADLMHTAVEQADNRDYGKLRVMSWVFGPSFGVATDAVGAAQAGIDTLLSEEPDSSAQRSAIRSVAQRIPVAGAIRPARQAIVDLVPKAEE